eukprot:CAMPEP_0194776222 /NCGR_PEP_ID=MMETSP0323_2-20130528/62475_1 /TAXON_ID=2866 ORGANISM="Crypthecodinium cohnii, Strain Seligo" /NCGR_SAMPLE_ID=MMETSP0323_2 /ASSEMBLY_ACC=CAM_ASM_000346 /LENGTH=55 /DNA_ID=CAMNT_0039712517 /DNA_START=86 /DNA_END=250 /DNA_ORIENTATION=+
MGELRELRRAAREPSPYAAFTSEAMARCCATSYSCPNVPAIYVCSRILYSPTLAD